MIGRINGIYKTYGIERKEFMDRTERIEIFQFKFSI